MELIVKMLRNIRFYFGFLAILVLIMFFSKSEVFSFRWFPAQLATQNLIVGEMNYVHKKNIQNLILGVSYSNISYGTHQWSTSAAAEVSITDIDSLLSLSERMERTASVNIGDLLKNSSQRDAVLNTHMKAIRTLVSQAQTASLGLDAFLTNTQMDYNACSANKAQADYTYSAGVNQNNSSLAEGGYTDALDSGTCETQKRIVLNAYSPIAAKIQAYLGVLQAQYSFMENNFTTLVSSYDLFEPGVLEQLQEVRDSLE